MSAADLSVQENRREQIIRIASAVLARDGYQKTSLKTIAREVGVAPGLLHYYFQSKEELLVEVVDALRMEMLAEWQEAIADIEEPIARIAAGVRHAAEKCAKRPEFWGLLFDLHALAMTNPVVKVRTQQLENDFIRIIEEEIESVAATLPGPPMVTPRDMAIAIAGAIQGIALNGLICNIDTDAAYSALETMLVVFAIGSYVRAGQSIPDGAVAIMGQRVQA